MLLSALLLAAALQAASPSPADQIGASRPTFYRSRAEAVKVREACQAPGVDLALNLAPTTRASVQMLGDLPKANHTLTVLRSIDGCPVSSTVRFNVDRSAGR